MEERYFGKISFPNSEQEPIENVWFTIGEKNMFVEVPMSIWRDESWSIVLGNFGGLGKVTFLGTRLGGGLGGGSAGDYRKLMVFGVLKGVHIETEQELMFNQVVLQSDALMNWLGFHHGVERSFNGKNITVPEDKDVFQFTFNDFSLQCKLQWGGSQSNHRVNIVHFCHVIFDFPESKHLGAFKDRIYHLKKLILFLTHNDPTFQKMILKRNDELIEWIVKYPEIESARFSANFDTPWYLLKDNLSDLIKVWFEDDQFQNVIDHLLECYFNPGLSMPRYYQNMCIAIESFHANSIQKKWPVPEIINQRRDYIIAFLKTDSILETDAEFLSWFRQTSKFWLNPQLFDRLSTFKGTLERMFDGTIDIDIDGMLRKIKKTRDEITHSGSPYNQFNRSELILVAKALEFTIRIAILEIIGVKIEQGDRSYINEAQSIISDLAAANNYHKEEDRIKRKG